MLYLLAVVIGVTAATTGNFATTKSGAGLKITKAAVYNRNNVRLQWTGLRTTSKYKVYRKKAGGKFVLVKTTKYRIFRNRNLAYGAKYTYRIKAIGKNGKVNSVANRSIYTSPAKPVLTVKQEDSGQVKLSWKKVKGAVRYKVYRKVTNGRFVLVGTTGKRQYADKKIKEDVRYSYKVKAVSNYGKSTVSAIRWIHTKTSTSALPDSSAPVEPELTPLPEISTPIQPERPESSEESILPEPPAIPYQPDAPDTPVESPEEEQKAVPPAEKLITVKIPVYTDETVYWIKDNETEAVVYQTTDAAVFEQEILTRANPETWHWGSGGVYMITGYETLIMTESEWEESWYNGQTDVIVEQS